ncbi:MAG TPA: single-stranded-DNA-specific exonuclease RecJ [Gammaproteobacteria bacterium]|nr:single-stranded-DNA-specific exonuclease RecJ [Gammaproteobacteria bacterium]
MIIRRHTDPELSAALLAAGESKLSPLIARLYAARRISPEHLDYRLQALARPAEMAGMEQAVDLLLHAYEQQSAIVVVADFDADGATSCALLVRGLRAFGFHNIDYLVPNRFEHGYGLTPEIADQAVAKGCQLLITVDNGISSIAGVAHAKSLGMQVLVTDHHLPPAQLPEADAIIDPNLTECGFPSKALAGVGVAYYLLLALRSRFQSLGRDELPNMAQWLDLVALGTVADMAQLDHNNRILVSQGLARIRAGRAQPGVLALIKIGGRDYRTLIAADLGFAVGPRLNAAGRLDDMATGIECLLATTETSAQQLATALDSLNRERREIENEMQQQAFELMDEMLLDQQSARFGEALFHPQWHQGVIGILASRVKNRLHRPVIAFAPADKDRLKGSARSIDGVHIRDQLANLDVSHPGLLISFGGHAMAAGLTIAAEKFDLFRQLFDQQVGEVLGGVQPGESYLSDGELTGQQFGLPLALSIRDAGPWGNGFDSPRFDGQFQLVSSRLVGDNHLQMVLRWPDSNRQVKAIAFGVADQFDLQPEQRLHLLYQPQINSWNGNNSAELLIERIYVDQPEIQQQNC